MTDSPYKTLRDGVRERGVMPRQRIYTTEGFLEVQWDRTGNLVCVVFGVQKSDSLPENFDTHMHQFTAEDHEDLKVLDVALHRATTKNRDANEVASSIWTVRRSADGSFCSEAAHCPPDELV